MDELALASFAAATESHLVAEPRSARFARFRAAFDGAAEQQRLAALGYRFLARTPTAASRRSCGRSMIRRRGSSCVVQRPRRRCSSRRLRSWVPAPARRMVGRSRDGWAGSLPERVSPWSAASHEGSTEKRIVAHSRPAERPSPSSAAGSIATIRRLIDRWRARSPRAVCSSPSTPRRRARAVAVSGSQPHRRRALRGDGRRRGAGAERRVDHGRPRPRGRARGLRGAGEITSALSAGSNALLRLGATPCTGSGDVLESFGLSPIEAVTPTLGPAAASVFERVREAATSADELARATGLGAAELAAVLTELELAGAVVVDEGLVRAAG